MNTKHTCNKRINMQAKHLNTKKKKLWERIREDSLGRHKKKQAETKKEG